MILHTGDWHLGKKTHGKIQGGENTRIQDQLRRIEELGAIAKEEDVDLTLFAGDMFDHATPSPTLRRKLLESVEPLLEAAPMIGIPGNHDHPITEGKSHALDLIREHPEVTIIDEPSVRVLDQFVLTALPWPLDHFAENQSVKETYLRKIEEGNQRAESLPHVIMGHFTVDGSLPAGSERSLQLSGETTFSPRELDADYTALAHVHKFQDLGGNVVYCSSPERLSFGEEGEKKGCITFDPQEPGEYAFHPASPRAFVTVEEDLREEESPQQALLDAIEEADVEEAIVRVRYQCQEDQPVDERDVEEALSSAHSIAAIERQVERKRSTRSTELPADSDLDDLVRAYAQSREGLEEIEDELVEKASAIAERV